ncbi:GTP-dependent nucleic acid-binding protein EngD [Mycobacteroides abscessus subsp. bolletii]|nr:GTP-dependent nucleic acid-binding protein EngD [Mycobacteroides abscessus subsp. bolletii]
MSLPCCSWFGRVPLGNAQPDLGDHWVLSASTRATPETAESLSCQPDFAYWSGQAGSRWFLHPGSATYLTAGPKETRAWTISKGDTAPQAAGVIHTDFERGFNKAEVVSFDDLDATGSMAETKTKGKVRIEGKDYIMQDGYVVEFRHNTTSGSGNKK